MDISFQTHVVLIVLRCWNYLHLRSYMYYVYLYTRNIGDIPKHGEINKI